MAPSIRVAVVDDHPLFREGVAHTLERSNLLSIVGQGETADDAIRIAQTESPDIMLLDVSMPGSGLAAADTISRNWPNVKIVMLTVSESEDHVQQALASGARGYILKGTSSTELVDTLRLIARGEHYVTPTLAARVLATVRRASKVPAQEEPFPDLTRREEQILDRVASGLTNREIAKSLEIGEKTVKHYMTSIMQKLRVRNRVEAALALRKRS
jgi:two-component system nitrate/nitrite response regulator NarL